MVKMLILVALHFSEATPKTIMRTMGVKGLTLYHLKSHLQVCSYRHYTDRAEPSPTLVLFCSICVFGSGVGLSDRLRLSIVDIYIICFLDALC